MTFRTALFSAMFNIYFQEENLKTDLQREKIKGKKRQHKIYIGKTVT